MDKRVEEIVDLVIAYIVEIHGEWGELCLGNEPDFRAQVLEYITAKAQTG